MFCCILIKLGPNWPKVLYSSLNSDVKTIKHSQLLHYSSEVLKETQNSKNTSLFFFIVYVASYAFLGRCDRYAAGMSSVT